MSTGKLIYILTPAGSRSAKHTGADAVSPLYIIVYPSSAKNSVGTMHCAHEGGDNCPDHGPGISDLAQAVVPAVYGSGVWGHDHITDGPGSADFNVGLLGRRRAVHQRSRRERAHHHRSAARRGARRRPRVHDRYADADPRKSRLRRNLCASSADACCGPVDDDPIREMTDEHRHIATSWNSARRDRRHRARDRGLDLLDKAAGQRADAARACRERVARDGRRSEGRADLRMPCRQGLGGVRMGVRRLREALHRRQAARRTRPAGRRASRTAPTITSTRDDSSLLARASSSGPQRPWHGSATWRFGAASASMPISSHNARARST